MTAMTEQSETREPIEVDGAQGEGGGQVLRTSLSLSIITGRPLRMHRIRARRRKPGLMRQHLTAVRAAAEICDAEVTGDELNSSSLSFTPGVAKAGDYRFSVGTAGSITLILQTVLWPLAMVPGRSTVRLEGGTHNPMAPTYDFLATSLRPILAQIGVGLELSLLRHGFYPAGGGVLEAAIEGGAPLRPIERLRRGPITRVRATAKVAELPVSIARRELGVVCNTLGWSPSDGRIERVSSYGPGNVLQLEAEHEGGTTVVSGFGEKGLAAELVAGRCCDRFARFREADVPIGPHLADQLLVPMALAGGGSFRTLTPTQHSRTNAELIERWLPVTIAFTDEGHDACRVDVRSVG